MVCSELWSQISACKTDLVGFWGRDLTTAVIYWSVFFDKEEEYGYYTLTEVMFMHRFVLVSRTDVWMLMTFNSCAVDVLIAAESKSG